MTDTTTQARAAGLLAGTLANLAAMGIPVPSVQAAAVDPYDGEGDTPTGATGTPPEDRGAAGPLLELAGAPPARPGEHLVARMYVEGKSTGLRTFHDMDWRATPFAYHWQYSSAAHGGQPLTEHVGNVVRHEDVDGTHYAYVRLDLDSPRGYDYARRVAAGFDRWVSIGYDETPMTSVLVTYPPDTGPPEDPAPGEPIVVDEAEFAPLSIDITGGVVGELTGVSVPALADAELAPTQELLDLFPPAQDSEAPPEDAVLVASAPAPPTPCACGGECDDCAEPTLAATVQTLTAAAFRMEIPELPPAAWFREPEDVEVGQALTITPEGRIYALLAPLGTQHRSYAGSRQKVHAPFGRVDYSRFMGAWALSDQGRIPAGPLTMDCGHASPAPWVDGKAALTHYDNACSVIGAVAVGESERLGGVWMAGALLPGVAPDQVARALACRCSGDWRGHPDKAGWQEFIACLLVPSPGFATAHSATEQYVGGALVASSVPVTHADPVAALPAADLPPAQSGAPPSWRSTVAALERACLTPAQRVLHHIGADR